MIDYLVGQGVYVNPTLVLTWGASTQRWRDWKSAAAQIVKDPGLAFVPAYVKEMVNQAVSWPGSRRLQSRGGLSPGGTPGGKGDRGNRYRTSLFRSFPGLVFTPNAKCYDGIPPMKAIQGTTLWAAEVIGQSKILAASSQESGRLYRH